MAGHSDGQGGRKIKTIVDGSSKVVFMARKRGEGPERQRDTGAGKRSREVSPPCNGIGRPREGQNCFRGASPSGTPLLAAKRKARGKQVEKKNAKSRGRRLGGRLEPERRGPSGRFEMEGLGSEERRILLPLQGVTGGKSAGDSPRGNINKKKGKVRGGGVLLRGVGSLKKEFMNRGKSLSKGGPQYKGEREKKFCTEKTAT